MVVNIASLQKCLERKHIVSVQAGDRPWGRASEHAAIGIDSGLVLNNVQGMNMVPHEGAVHFRRNDTKIFPHNPRIIAMRLQAQDGIHLFSRVVYVETLFARKAVWNPIETV